MILKLKVDRFENGSVVLKTQAAKTIVWPKENLPDNIQEGSVLRVAIALDSKSEGADKELARDILNEILKT